MPSDHAAARVVIQKPTGCSQDERIPSWMSKYTVFCIILKEIHDDHQYLADPFVAVADFKVFLEKARKRTVRELLRKTPDSLGAKLLTASTAVRPDRKRHLGTLMLCCQAWEPVERCSDQNSVGCVGFRGLSQIIESLTRERLTEIEAGIGDLPWTQTEKDHALATCRLGLRP